LPGIGLGRGQRGKKGAAMKITNLGVNNTLLSSQPPIDESGSSVAAGLTDKKGYTPSAELLHLIHLARQTPEIRPERVHAASERLAKGEYLTPASAAKTAAAMLQHAAATL
jgi:hypothetical protein